MKTTLDDFELGADITIRKTTRKYAGAGTWVMGTIHGHRFDALVFPEHAEREGFELERSRISKLWLKRMDEGGTVANFDRGWDVRPVDDEAEAIVDFLAAMLADAIYP